MKDLININIIGDYKMKNKKDEYVLFDDVTTIALVKFIINNIDKDFKIRNLASTDIMKNVQIQTVGLDEVTEENVNEAVEKLVNREVPNLQIVYNGRVVVKYKANLEFKIYDKKTKEFIMKQNQQITRIKNYI